MSQIARKPRTTCKIISNNQLVDKIFEMILVCPEIAAQTRPGQFINLYCRHQGRLLPRPVSVCETDLENGHLHLVYAILGTGTEEFSGYRAGETIEVMGPLGRGFKLGAADNRYLIVAGGVGTPPMVELCKQLKGEKTIVVGFRDTPYLIDRLKQYGDVHITTDNGSTGFKGHVVELIEKKSLKGTIYACGPTLMLQSVQNYAEKNSLQAYLSLEERMGCGFGACVGCVTKIIADNEAGWTYKKICKDGPVFDAGEVLFP